MSPSPSPSHPSLVKFTYYLPSAGSISIAWTHVGMDTLHIFVLAQLQTEHPACHLPPPPLTLPSSNSLTICPLPDQYQSPGHMLAWIRCTSLFLLNSRLNTLHVTFPLPLSPFPSQIHLLSALCRININRLDTVGMDTLHIFSLAQLQTEHPARHLRPGQRIRPMCPSRSSVEEF